MIVYNKVTWVDENDTVFIFSFFRNWIPFPRPYQGKEKRTVFFLTSDVYAPTC